MTAGFYPDGSALLVGHDHAARSELYRYDLATGALEKLDTPPGVVRGATARPDGTVELAWSSSALPPVIRRADGPVVLSVGDEEPPAAYPVEDRWVPGPGGDVHALLVRPEGPGPYATAFLVHGGPESADDDSYRARRAAYVDAGYAVVHVNYRGSTGYGSAWRDALTGRPGLTELEDVGAVYDALVAEGVVDPQRALLSGGSWGGFLTLLGLGTQPERWAAGIAEVPVADYLAAYEDEMEGLRAYDRALFGGSPEEVRDVYVRSSPITYVDAVAAPVLVVAGANDPRCPIRQIDNYLARLEELGKEHEVYRFDAGHGSLVIEETIRQVEVALAFALRTVPPGRGSPDRAPGRPAGEIPRREQHQQRQHGAGVDAPPHDVGRYGGRHSGSRHEGPVGRQEERDGDGDGEQAGPDGERARTVPRPARDRSQHRGPGCHVREQDHRRDDPVQVVHPRDRAHQAGGQPRERDGGEVVPAPVHPHARAPARGRRHRRRAAPRAGGPAARDRTRGPAGPGPTGSTD